MCRLLMKLHETLDKVSLYLKIFFLLTNFVRDITLIYFTSKPSKNKKLYICIIDNIGDSKDILTLIKLVNLNYL